MSYTFRGQWVPDFNSWQKKGGKIQLKLLEKSAKIIDLWVRIIARVRLSMPMNHIIKKTVWQQYSLQYSISWESPDDIG